MQFKVIAIAVIASAIALPTAHSQTAAEKAKPLQGRYSVAPLRDPLFDQATVVVRATGLNNWLTDNIQKLGYEQMQGPRENLYYLIESRIKQLYAEDKRILPSKHDPILEMLFSWSENLGVFGGSYAFNAVKAPTTKAEIPRLQLPVEIKLNLDADLFKIQSDHGWSVRLPYYFMISQIGDFTATGGSRTQLLGFSTGAAKDKGELGYSQATIVFIYSPAETSFDSFETYWLKQLGIEASIQQAPLNILDLRSRHVFDAAIKMNKEFVAWSKPSGSFAVLYAGLEGSYEWNRPHFLDFLRTIETRDGSAPSK
jgi:hypothetical protein